LKQSVDPNVPSSLLKLFLRELAEPLIPAEFYNDCIKVGQEEGPNKTSATLFPVAKAIIDGLPGTVLDTVLHLSSITHYDLVDINKNVAYYMIRFLKVTLVIENRIPLHETIHHVDYWRACKPTDNQDDPWEFGHGLCTQLPSMPQ
jgi:RhoGAP domain